MTNLITPLASEEVTEEMIERPTLDEPWDYVTLRDAYLELADQYDNLRTAMSAARTPDLTRADGKTGLKPCPFCGGTDVASDCNGENDFDVTCLNCKSGTISAGPSKEDRTSAIAAWNTRTPDPSTAEKREIAKEALERARLLIGLRGQNERLSDVAREGNLNEAWHILDAALAKIDGSEQG